MTDETNKETLYLHLSVSSSVVKVKETNWTCRRKSKQERITFWMQWLLFARCVAKEHKTKSEITTVTVKQYVLGYSPVKLHILSFILQWQGLECSYIIMYNWVVEMVRLQIYSPVSKNIKKGHHRSLHHICLCWQGGDSEKTDKLYFGTHFKELQIKSVQ